jgi:hypothetical protein
MFCRRIAGSRAGLNCAGMYRWRISAGLHAPAERKWSCDIDDEAKEAAMSPAERSAAIEVQHEAAATAYIALQAKAAAQIEAITAALEAYQDGIDPERADWGHVGDLSHALELLGQVEEWLVS